MTIAFVTPPHDRQSTIRTDSARLGALRRHPEVRVIKVCKETVLMTGPALDVAPVSDDRPVVFLGLEGDAPWFAAEIDECEGLVTLRELMLSGQLPATELTLLAQAKAMIDWHARHGHCAKCGEPTELADAGYRRHCNACNAEHFPRTDPVVIMVVTCGQDMLLGRQASWTPGQYSALAGFMEPGETIEQAVAREVHEETGVTATNVRYVNSQPWPFPSSIMIGAIATTESKELQIDTKELETARWFSIQDIELMLERKHPENFYATHPYAIAHHLVTHTLNELRSPDK